MPAAKFEKGFQAKKISNLEKIWKKFSGKKFKKNILTKKLRFEKKFENPSKLYFIFTYKRFVVFVFH